MNQNKKRMWWAVIPLLALVLFIGLIWRGEVLVPGDILSLVDDVWHTTAPVQNPLLSDVLFQFYPWQSFLFQSLHTGILPLWNPHVLSGLPFLANHQSAPFDFVRLITFGFGFSAAGSFLPGAILRLSLFGIFSALWFRSRGFSSGLAVVLAGTAMVAAPNMVWISYPLFAVFMWLPLLLYGIDLVPSRRRMGMIIIALGTAGHIFAGNIQMSLFVTLFCLAYALVMLTRPWWRSIAWVVAGMGLGFGLSAVQLLPTLTFVHQSSVYETGRSGYAGTTILQAATNNKWTGWHSWAEAKRQLMLLTPFVEPEVFGNPATNSYRFPDQKLQNNFNELAGSAGLAAMWLALFGIAVAWRERTVKFLTISLGIMGGMVTHAPGFELLNYLPLVQQTSTGRLRFLMAFSLVALAGYGIRSLHGLFQARRRAWLLVSGLLVLGFGGGVLWYSSAIIPTARMIGFLWIGLILLGVATVSIWNLRHHLRWIVLGVIMIIPGAWELHAYNPSVDAKILFPRTAVLDQVKSVVGDGRVVGISGLDRLVPVRPNGSMLFGLRDIRGYEVVRLRRYEALTDGMFVRAGSYQIAVDHPDPRLNLLGVTVGFVAKSDPLQASFMAAGWTIQQPGSAVSILKNPQAFPRTFFITHPRQVAAESSALQLARSEVQTPAGTVIEGPTNILAQNSQVSSATVTDESPNQVGVEVVAPANGFVVLNDSYDPGWKAYVDGRITLVQPANYALRAVAVPAGRHSIIFRYQPRSFVIGGWVSLAAGVLIIAIIIFMFLGGLKVLSRPHRAP